MLCVEPIVNINYRPSFKASGSETSEPRNKDNKNSLLAASLAVLAAAGAATVGLVKSKPSSFEEALGKAGVVIKDKIARKASSDEKFTGTIEHFIARNKKETVEYLDGVITEKVYHNAFGKELNGSFYKDGKLKYKVGISGSGRNKHISTYEYKEDGSFSRGHGTSNSGNIFEEYRKLVKAT